ncbi:MAG: hypothetical protein CSB44_07010 [Gammaproteobacteria bacterium]|nr:MAG: hypothetical protein CSB44_07010 [Gammaproteobacteria bacterium]
MTALTVGAVMAPEPVNGQMSVAVNDSPLPADMTGGLMVAADAMDDFDDELVPGHGLSTPASGFIRRCWRWAVKKVRSLRDWLQRG